MSDFSQLFGYRSPADTGGTINRHVQFKEPVISSGMDELDPGGHPNERELPGNWVPGNPPYNNIVDDTSMYSPYLQPVPEEPSSSFSEGEISFPCAKKKI